MLNNMIADSKFRAFPNKNSKQKRTYAIFICAECKIEYTRVIEKNNKCYCPNCVRKFIVRKPNKKQSVYKTRIYKIFHKMKSRCNNINDDAYVYYGARGIVICEDWGEDFYCFKKWALENGYQDDLTIDRIDNDKGYSSNNCRWVKRTIQQRNQRKLRKNNTSGVRGVSNHKNGYIVQITVDSKHIYLGYTKDIIEGAFMYDNYVDDNNLEHTKNFKTSTDAIGFIQETKGMSFKDSVNYVESFI